MPFIRVTFGVGRRIFPRAGFPLGPGLVEGGEVIPAGDFRVAVERNTMESLKAAALVAGSLNVAGAAAQLQAQG
ncbi:hypothetical protein [Streptomyces afghaniensis]|uniref:hypothetical protein n=1 Tax=Streptomyces afghaniensis TaxID=66865 RepID=UPI00278746AD|nr:hypothetical protein [Streptomyces afghaniensis]MDQ1019410.1 hypothetical protein [Streptomyces afghaniensis]